MKGCSVCAQYSRQLLRCKMGKINPRTIKGGVDAARFMGISYICYFSPLKQKIIQRLTEGRV